MRDPQFDVFECNGEKRNEEFTELKIDLLDLLVVVLHLLHKGGVDLRHVDECVL